MRSLAIANQKGGSGKTTTAVNLAAALAESDRSVLLVDLDPQGSASAWLRAAPEGKGAMELFLDGRPLSELACTVAAPGLAVVPASEWLASAERLLAGEVGAEMLLRKSLEGLPVGKWDYVLLDCPPALGILTVNALAAARELLVPIEAHVMPLNGLVQLMRSVELVRGRLNPALAVAGILACRVNRRTRHALEVVEELRRRFGPLVLRSEVRESVRLAECPSFGEPVTRYAGRSAGAEDYRAVASEILEQERSG